jgi:hypothetical protein
LQAPRPDADKPKVGRHVRPKAVGECYKEEKWRCEHHCGAEATAVALT